MHHTQLFDRKEKSYRAVACLYRTHFQEVWIQRRRRSLSFSGEVELNKRQNRIWNRTSKVSARKTEA